MAESYCPVCGRLFYKRTGQHRFCTPVCREKAAAAMKPRRSRGKYSYEHQKERREVAPLVAAGRAVCPRCDELIGPHERWDLDHLPDGSRRPAHAYCNRAAGSARAKELAAVRNGHGSTGSRWPRKTSREW